MITKVLIDLDDNMDPVVRISNLSQWASSDDVRDKVAKQFVENLSNRMAAVKFEGDDAVIVPASVELVLEWLFERYAYGSEAHEKIKELISIEEKEKPRHGM